MKFTEQEIDKAFKELIARGVIREVTKGFFIVNKRAKK